MPSGGFGKQLSLVIYPLTKKDFTIKKKVHLCRDPFYYVVRK